MEVGTGRLAIISPVNPPAIELHPFCPQLVHDFLPIHLEKPRGKIIPTADTKPQSQSGIRPRGHLGIALCCVQHQSQGLEQQLLQLVPVLEAVLCRGVKETGGSDSQGWSLSTPIGVILGWTR